MNDNEFTVPFERAFKRLRVDGDDLSKDSIKKDKTPNDKASKGNFLSLTKHNLPSSTSSSTWRSIDKSVTFETQNSIKTSFNQVDDKISMNKLKLDDKFELSTLDKPFNQFNSIQLRSPTAESDYNLLLNEATKKVKSSSNTELARNCSHQARNESDITVDELSAYLDLQLYLPKKMSFMASMAYS